MNAALHIERLSELSACAHRLGVAFAEAAERAQTHERRMEFFRLFDRCFFSVRVAIALELRLSKTSAAPASAFAEHEDAAEREERPERYDDRERDRDDERETASLPVLLRTLEDVAAEAAALPGPPPADLPTLKELLAQITSEPGPRSAAPRSAAPRSAGPRPLAPLRARLAGSGATLVLDPPQTAAPARPGSHAFPGSRGSTGPPRR